MAKSVYYASDGINVRKTAAGTVDRAIVKGSLMIYDSVNGSESKALNGTTYTWIKVTYFYDDGYTYHLSATGYIAKENATLVSTTVPAKSSTTSSNSTLAQNVSLVNARYITKYLRGLPTATRWSVNAICGMLGNMEQESTINPGRWQNGTSTASNGYGLVQWTPSTNYTNWLKSGEEKSDIDNQLKRIEHEVANELQWLKSYHSPQITFASFSQSTKTVKELAEYFLRCYERPASVATKVATRQALAQKWYDILSAIGDI